MRSEYTDASLIDLYAERLSPLGVSSVGDLDAAVKSGAVDLTFDINAVVSPEKREAILKANPDEVLIGQRSFKVSYKYGPYSGQHTAEVTIGMGDVFGIDELPELPSGRKLTIKLTDDSYERFTGQELAALKETAEDYLLNKQWEAFKYSGNAPKEQTLVEFNPLTSSVPTLPPPVVYGTNPKTHESAQAQAALTYSPSYWSGNGTYSVTYYKTMAEAETAQGRALAQIEIAKEEKRKEDEKQQLLTPAKAAYTEFRAQVEQLTANYSSYGLSWSESSALGNLIYDLQWELERNPSGVMEKIAAARARLSTSVELKTKREEVKRNVDKLVAEKYGTCPLCGSSLEGGMCRSRDHDVTEVSFETDDYGRPTGPVTLSRIKVVTANEGDKIAAILKCSDGSNRRQSKGDIQLLTGYDIPSSERWEGQDGAVVYEDTGALLTKEEREKLDREAALRPLPEGVLLIGGSIDNRNKKLYAIHSPEDDMWHIVNLERDGTVAGYKGFRSQSTGVSPQALIREYYRGYNDLSAEALAAYNASLASVGDNPMADAFRRANDAPNESTSQVDEETDSSDGETINASKRKKLEGQVVASEVKLTHRLAELARLLSREQAVALNVTSGEANVSISSPGSKFVARFNKEDDKGVPYAEIVEWPNDRVLHLYGAYIEGDQYVQVVEPEPDSEFESEELGLRGLKIRVAKVDLVKDDEIVQTQQNKLARLKRRLAQ